MQKRNGGFPRRFCISEEFMKKIVREYQFSPEQLKRVEEVSRTFDLTPTTVKLLFARGIDDEEKLVRFLRPSRKNLLSPFLMSGMKEAVSMLSQAREEGWTVVVFGDYDADGIGASAILSRALKEYGIEPYVYVPERTEGYGLSISAIDKIFDEVMPDLFVTVDCGISNREEVEYIKEQGAYVVVTDHHELPDLIPDCICVNPKIADDYPYDNLCGAGVAFKLAQALIGEDAYSLLDYAALSTVADSVPLLGENRDIVAEGLKLIERSPRPAFSALLGKQNGEITAQTLAFSLAPRINAAGRMGDANAALKLFTTDDEGEIFTLAAKLNEYNLERQQCCDEVYAQATAQIKQKGAFGNVIVLVGEDWNAGFVGIVAAKICEEYARPALLFVRRGDMLKGSARSIEGVNIFEALKACSEHIYEFGGHAQAAGINVEIDKIGDLERALNEYIGSRYTREDFVPKIYVSEEIHGAFPMKLARELNLLEPFGVGQRKPLFTVKAEKMNARLTKANSPHVSASVGGMDFMYFGGAKHLPLLESDVQKTLVFECNLSKFRGKEYLKGFIRSVLYDGTSGKEAELGAMENGLRALRSAKGLNGVEELDTRSLNALIEEKRGECAYGFCAVAYSRDTLKQFPALSGMDVDLYEPSSGSYCNTLLVAPRADCDLSGYREVAYLDKPTAFTLDTGRAKTYVNSDICGYGWVERLSVTRENLLEIYAALRQAESLEGSSYAEVARNCDSLDFPQEQFTFALAVFEDLGLISLSEGRVELFRGKKTELTDSVVYAAISRMLEEA